MLISRIQKDAFLTANPALFKQIIEGRALEQGSELDGYTLGVDMRFYLRRLSYLKS